MNKFLILIILIIFVLGVVVFNSINDDGDVLKSSKNNSFEFEVIKPPQINDAEGDLYTSSQMNDLVIKNQRNLQERLKPAEKGEYPDAKNGNTVESSKQELLKNQKRVYRKVTALNIATRVEEIKSNVEMSKEIAALSKNLFIDTAEGKVIDQDVSKQINELSDKLIAAIKKQQNLE